MASQENLRISYDEIVLIKVSHTLQYTYTDKKSPFLFKVKTEEIIRKDTIVYDMFFGSGVNWKDTPGHLCDCQDAWYEMEVYRKKGIPFRFVVSPCTDDFESVEVAIDAHTYKKELNQYERKKLLNIFEPLVQNQKRLQRKYEASQKCCSGSN